ncbi:DHHA1 domain-containing protein [Halobacteriaceae archaeon SHR40]|uniref:alanyl-tRNA editing protein n=1 Tax=Halovenus amylolytica TaxID=2500550 RepID=UPI000FE397C9
MHSRAPAAPTVTEFETTVDRIEGETVVLDETYFYPEGGGQPADRGVIESTTVEDVQTVDGEVHHELASPPEFGPGQTVSCAIDAQFRRYLMRAHTASHALYGAGRRILDDLGYGGFGITEQKVRVDFETATEISDTTLVELERLVNRIIWESRAVSWRTVPREDALSNDAVAFNTKTEEGLTGETVRLVEIEDWDVAACGGTHVASTDEITNIRVLDRSNPGEGLTRVEFAVGPQAIQHRAREDVAARTAARALDTRLTELPDAVDRLRTEKEQLAEEVENLRAQVIEARLSDLRDATVQKEGDEWLAGVVPSDDANALAESADRLIDQTADVVALVGESGEYVAVATTGEVDAREVVSKLTDRFGGGGGGSQRTAQAGGLDAPPDEIVAALRATDQS